VGGEKASEAWQGGSIKNLGGGGKKKKVGGRSPLVGTTEKMWGRRITGGSFTASKRFGRGRLEKKKKGGERKGGRLVCLWFLGAARDELAPGLH